MSVYSRAVHEKEPQLLRVWVDPKMPSIAVRLQDLIGLWEFGLPNVAVRMNTVRKDAVEILPLLVCRGYKNNFVIHVFFSLFCDSLVFCLSCKSSQKKIFFLSWHLLTLKIEGVSWWSFRKCSREAYLRRPESAVAVLVLSTSFVFVYEFQQMCVIHVKIKSFFSWFTCMGYRLEHCYVLW